MQWISTLSQNCLWIALTTFALAAKIHAEVPAPAKAEDSGSPVVLAVNDLFRIDPLPVGNLVVVQGFPTTVCKRDGRKAWIKDQNPDADHTIRVERTGDMRPFDMDSVGTTIRVTGYLRERRMDAAYFDEWEAKVRSATSLENQQPASANGACEKGCGTSNSAQQKTLDRIARFREQLAKSPKGYLASLWIDGTAWEFAETTALR